MILIPPDVNYFTVFNFNIFYYSVCIFAACFISFLLAYFVSEKYFPSVDRNVILDFSPFLLLFSIIGARIYYVLLSLDYFLLHPVLIPMVWKGGISIHGAFIGGVIFGLIYFKKKSLKFLPYADIYALVLPLGQAIGRWGNFFNSEAFGAPVLSEKFPFYLYIKESLRPLDYAGFEYFHPVFLYESVLDFLIFIVLFILMKKTAKKYDGLIFFSYILLYSLVRAFLEFLRLDTVFYLFSLPFPVLVSIIGIITGAFGIFSRLKAQGNSIF